jgi:hypothetical protein
MSIRDVIDATYIKNTFVLGVDLTLDDGTPFPDVLWETSIDSAISTLEMELGIQIDPFVIKGERHDARLQERTAFYPFHLDYKPAISVEKLQITLGNYPAVDLPKSWVTFASNQHSTIHLIPTAETVGSFFFRSGIPLIFGDVFSPYSYVPAYFSVDYTSGFSYLSGTATIPSGETSVEVSLSRSLSGIKPTVNLTTDYAGAGGTFPRVRTLGTDSFVISVKTAPDADMNLNWELNTVDPAIIRAVGLMSAMLPLDIAGDLIIGAGISQLSMNVDGLSQYIGTTSSPTNAGYGARLKAFERELERLIPALKAKYRTVNMLAV